MKSIQLKRSTGNSDKENIHPNIQLLSTEQQIGGFNLSKYPKVSMFRPVPVQESSARHSQKDWRKRILALSSRQKQLNGKLIKMMMGKDSPIKVQKIAIPTQAASHSKNSQKQLGNTLRRYLYQRSNQNTTSMMEAYSINNNILDLVQQLHKLVEQITGSQVQLTSGLNPEEVLSSVLDILKQYKNTLLQPLNHKDMEKLQQKQKQQQCRQINSKGIGEQQDNNSEL